MRKFLKRILYFLLGLGVLLLILYLSPYAYLIKGINATYLQGEDSATIVDKDFFQTALIRADHPVPWPENFQEGMEPGAQLDSLLETTETVAFAVFKKDTLIYEEYAPGYGRNSRTNSFSMAKTVIAILVDVSIANGDIQSWDQKVKDFLPWLQGRYASDLTLRHLSNMQAGLNWDEHYKSAFGITAMAYYGDDVQALFENDVFVTDKPGEKFEYQSGCHQLLGMCLEVATHRPVADLTSEWLWTPTEAEDDAEWHTDDHQQAITYCCLNSNALDFARIGHLLLHQGWWKDKHILDSTVVQNYFSPISTEYYGRSIWLGTKNNISYSYLRGINGQFVIVVPSHELVIVRLGHKKGPHVADSTVPLIVDLAVGQYAQ